jgi:hypothetical protein
VNIRKSHSRVRMYAFGFLRWILMLVAVLWSRVSDRVHFRIRSKGSE